MIELQGEKFLVFPIIFIHWLLPGVAVYAFRYSMAITNQYENNEMNAVAVSGFRFITTNIYIDNGSLSYEQVQIYVYTHVYSACVIVTLITIMQYQD